MSGLAIELGQKLCLTAPFHRDEPPYGLLDALANGDEAVVSEDGCLVRSETAGDVRGLVRLGDEDPGVVDEHVVLVECAGVLRDRVEQAPQRRPGLAVDRMRVRRRHHVGASPVDLVSGWRMPRRSPARYPSTTSPAASTRMRSETLMWPKCIPNGLTQKVSGNSGSRAVMWPATPSQKPHAAKIRKPPARRSFRCCRSSARVAKAGGARRLNAGRYAARLRSARAVAAISRWSGSVHLGLPETDDGPVWPEATARVSKLIRIAPKTRKTRVSSTHDPAAPRVRPVRPEPGDRDASPAGPAVSGRVPRGSPARCAARAPRRGGDEIGS